MITFGHEGSNRVAMGRLPCLPSRESRRQSRLPVLLLGLLLATVVQADGGIGAAAPATPSLPTGDATAPTACTTLFSENDPRLFDFVGTRKAVDFRAFQGKAIGHIRYIALPVFNTADPEEDRVLYRGANRVHISTREATLRKQVLLHDGDTLDDDLVRESERILRDNNYLYDAMILPGEVCGDHLDLLVVARDIWTLEPTLNFSRNGSQNSSSLGFSENNLLGSGRSLTLSLDKSAARTSTILGYSDRHLFDGHSVLEVAHGDSSDGSKNGFSLQRPFYAFDTRRSGGIDLRDETLTETTTAAGITSNVYDHREEFAEAFFGWSAGEQGDVAARWRLGITRRADSYTNQLPGSVDPLPGNRRFVYPWLEYEHVENRFITTSNVSRMFRNEDINIGTSWRLRGGMTNSNLGSVQDGILLQGDWHDTLGFGSHHLLRNSLHADIFTNESDGTQRDTLYGYQARYDYFIDDNDRWLAALKLDAGEQLSPETQLKTGGENGMLGYPDAWQRGDRRVVFGIERRHFLDAHPFNLVRIATAVFAEAGQAWDTTGAIVQSDSTLYDVGIGLRLNSSKARSNNIVQFNIAMPLSDSAAAGGVQWSIFAGESF